MTEYVYKLENGKIISAYADEKGNMTITKKALEIMVNSWNDAYQQGRADAEEDAENRMQRILDGEKMLSYEQGKADADVIEECISKIDKLTTYYAGDKERNAITPKMVIKEDVIKVLEQLKKQIS